jgi:isoleucyl-tRNA synthetase
MRRIPTVLDCWFESGSMPYAQMHYPFENKEKFEANFPAEFIAEGVDQTRAWFYYMHILSNGLKKTNAFKNVIANGIVLAEDGKKMSKKLRNYPDPMDLMEKSGADTMRYYLCASQVMKADNLCFSEKDMKEQTRFFNTLFNILSFYQIYEKDFSDTELFGADAKLENILDKWILARLNETIKKVTEKLDVYDLHAVREIPNFIDELSVWYVRRSRDRFKGEDEADKNQAIFTLGKVLFELSKLLAPFVPFTAEYLYQELGKECGCLKESVHLEDWPKVNEKLIDQKVLDYMAITRQVVELGLAKRAEVKIKIRQPLSELRVTGYELQKDYLDLIKDELNVKNIACKKGSGELSVEFDINLTDDLKAEGILRELTRTINGLRKDAGLTIDDFIKLEYNTIDEQISRVFEKYSVELKKAVLAKEISQSDESLEKVKINDSEVGLKITKV